MTIPANDAVTHEPPGEVEVLTVRELALLLRLHIKTVYEELTKGNIPGARKVAGTWRIHRATVVGWLAGQNREPRPQKGGRR